MLALLSGFKDITSAFLPGFENFMLGLPPDFKYFLSAALSGFKDSMFLLPPASGKLFALLA